VFSEVSKVFRNDGNHTANDTSPRPRTFESRSVQFTRMKCPKYFLLRSAAGSYTVRRVGGVEPDVARYWQIV
jgi:hypothetical protein